MALRLAGKIALITGAGGGIGAETARLFAREGASVIINDVNRDTADAVAHDIREAGGRAATAIADISSASQVDSMFSVAAQTFGGLDILINNAFFNVNDVTIVDLDESDWDR